VAIITVIPMKDVVMNMAIQLKGIIAPMSIRRFSRRNCLDLAYHCI